MYKNFNNQSRVKSLFTSVSFVNAIKKIYFLIILLSLVFIIQPQALAVSTQKVSTKTAQPTSKQVSTKTSQSTESELSKNLNSMHSYQANFKQESQDSDGQVVQRSSGRFLFQRPGKLRWEAYKPTHQIIVASGKTLWTYDVDLAQATKRKLDPRRDVAVQLLSGDVSKVLSQYKVTKKSSSAKSSAITYKLLPKNLQQSNFSWVQLTFENNKLTAMITRNNLDQNSKFDFLDIKINKTIKKSWFDFKPPAGVDVIKEGQF